MGPPECARCDGDEGCLRSRQEWLSKAAHVPVPCTCSGCEMRGTASRPGAGALPCLPLTCLCESDSKLAVSFNIEGLGEKAIKACHGCLAGSLTRMAARLSSGCTLLYGCLLRPGELSH